MNAPLTSTAVPPDVEQVTGAHLFASDVNHIAGDARLGFLLADHVWERLLARGFGVPRPQSLLVKAVLTAAAASVAGGYLARLPFVRPTGVDVAMGGSVLSAAIRGLAGAPSRNIPGVSILIGVAVVTHSVRAVVAPTSAGWPWRRLETRALSPGFTRRSSTHRSPRRRSYTTASRSTSYERSDS